MIDWISCDERMPDTDSEVFAWDAEDKVVKTNICYTSMGWLWIDPETGKQHGWGGITHWMPYPTEGPKDQK